MKPQTKIILGIVIAAVLVAGGYLFGHSLVNQPSQQSVGAPSSFQQGQVQNEPFIFTGGFSAGANQQFYVSSTGIPYAQQGITEGGLDATTTNGNTTLNPSDISGDSLISINPIVNSMTATLPATTTAGMSSYLPNIGDSDRFEILNATTTAGKNLTIAGNTGILLDNASTSAVITPQGVAFMSCVRKPNTDISCYFSPAP